MPDHHTWQVCFHSLALVSVSSIVSSGTTFSTVYLFGIDPNVQNQAPITRNDRQLRSSEEVHQVRRVANQRAQSDQETVVSSSNLGNPISSCLLEVQYLRCMFHEFVLLSERVDIFVGDEVRMSHLQSMEVCPRWNLSNKQFFVE